MKKLLGGGNMRKGIVPLIIWLLLVLPIPFTSAAVPHPEKAVISPVVLNFGDSVQIANYTIQFYDVSSNWSLVTIQVSYPGGAQLFFLKEGQTGYFPSRGSEVFEITVDHIDEANQMVVLSIASPLKLVRDNMEMTPNETVVLNANVRLHLFASWENGAKLGVQLPPFQDFEAFNLTRGKGEGFSYQLGEGIEYTNYLYVGLESASSSSAVLDVYMPVLAAENLTLKKIPYSNGSRPLPGSEKKPFVQVFRDYLYPGESLQLTTDNGTFSIGLKSLEALSANILVSTENESLDTTLYINSGLLRIDSLPVLLSLEEIDTDHERALISVYAPLGSEVSKPERPADVKVSAVASPKELLLGDNVVISINVENDGRGEARDLVVAAPVPQGFELVSAIKGWSIGDLPAFSKVPALVYVLKPTSVGEFSISGITATYYNESGQKVEISAEPITGIRVYSTPKLEVSILGSNSTFGGNLGTYVHAENNSPVLLVVNVSALGGNPEFEFAKGVSLHLQYPDGVVGPALIGLGDISAGQNIEKALQIRVLQTGRFPIRASLTYKDPLGNEHELDLGTVLVVDTVPPKVIVHEKTIHVYPSENELPAFVNQTLKNSTNASALALKLQEVIEGYLPEKGPDYWKISAIILLIIALILGYLAYGYYREVQTFRRFLLRKRKSRPGGLPKKWKRDELELLLREIRLEAVRENLPAQGGKPPERKE